MPQLDVTTFPSQLFWLGASFLFLYFFLSIFLLPKVTNLLGEREKFREEKLNLASTYREQAEALLLDYENALAKARKDAQLTYQSILHETALRIAEKKKELIENVQERLHIAEQDLYRARIEAGQDIPAVAQDLAAEILQKLTGQSFSAKQLIKQKDRE